MKRSLTIVAILATAAVHAQAYTLVVQNQGGQYLPLRWPARAMPLRFSVNEATGPALPNVTDDSDPRAAIERALALWPSVAAVVVTSATTSAASAGNDGVNLISLADTAANRRLFETAGDAVALTLFFFTGTSLLEADIVLNPDRQFTTTVDAQADLDASGLYDVEGQVAHEMGHAIGLDHTGVEAAAMWAIASLAQRRLTSDDVAGVRVLYPADGEFGRIAGTLLVNGTPAFGAQVIALAEDGVAVSSLTLPDGSYAIENLDPGHYTLYVEPLDGPQGAQPTGDCITFGGLSTSGIYGGATLTTDFATTFLGGTQDATLVSVRGGVTSLVDLDVAGTPSLVNPTLVGTARRAGTALDLSLGASPVELYRRTQPCIAVAGPGLDTVGGSDLSVLGTGVAIDPATRSLLDITCNGEPLPMLLFRIAVAPDAATGDRTLLVSAEGGIATMTGAFFVRDGTDPAACAGDCDGNAMVTVDELVVGVNIALGNMDTTDCTACTAFDVNVDNQVTVDELIASVGAALDGCPSRGGP